MSLLPLAATALCALAPFAASQDPKPAAAKPAAVAARPDDVATPQALVAAIYDVISGPAGQAREWDRMRSLFHAEAKLVPMVKAKDGMRPLPLTVDDYVRRSGPLLERDGFFEQEIACRTDVFGDFAHAFSTYESRRRKDDAEPFMRGINSIQMVREAGRWWVLHVLWEQEHDAGPIPAQYLPERAPTAKATRLLVMKGSDLLLELAQQWAEAHHALHPEVGIAVTGGGTSVGFQALATGEAQLAMASRRMSEAELAAVRASGAEAMELQIAWQALAVCVRAENPLRSLTLEQLAAIYGDADTITKWSQLGVKWPDGADDTIVVASRQSNSGAYEFFRAQVLGKASYRLGIAELNGSKDIVDFVAALEPAIGYCTPEYLGDAVRAVALAGKQGTAAVLPTEASVRDGSYPLARPVYLYFRDEPTGRAKAFVQWIQGPDGRALTQQAGYVTKPQ